MAVNAPGPKLNPVDAFGDQSGDGSGRGSESSLTSVMKPFHIAPARVGRPAQAIVRKIIHEMGVIAHDGRQIVAEGIVLTVYGYGSRRRNVNQVWFKFIQSFFKLKYRRNPNSVIAIQQKGNRSNLNDPALPGVLFGGEAGRNNSKVDFLLVESLR